MCQKIHLRSYYLLAISWLTIVIMVSHDYLVRVVEVGKIYNEPGIGPHGVIF